MSRRPHRHFAPRRPAAGILPVAGLLVVAAALLAPPAVAQESAMVDPDAPLAAACENEIAELHRFFEDWYRGTLPDEDAAFERFAGVMGEGLVFIGPGGRPVPRADLLATIRENHGSWVGQPAAADARIWIENVQLVRRAGETALVTYEEWQRIAGNTRGRIATVLFQLDEAAPNGLVWLHVHETFLPRGSQPQDPPGAADAETTDEEEGNGVGEEGGG